MFLTSQSILQPVRVTETLSYPGPRSVFTAALRESAVPAIYMWVILREAQRDATQVFNQALPQHLVGSSLKLGGRSEFLRQ